MKHLHMLIAVVIVLLFVYQGVMAWQGRMAHKPIKIMTHIAYGVMLITGIIMLMSLLQLNVPMQWLIAKVVVFIAFISASSKAYRLAGSSNLTGNDLRIKVLMGLFVALIALVGIFGLAFIKPSNFI